MNTNQLIKSKKANRFLKAIVLGAFVLAANSSFAQKGFYAGLSTGIQGFSLVNTQDQAAGQELDFTLKSNMFFGIGGGYNVNKHIGVSLDILFSKQTQGYKGKSVTSPDSNVYSTQIAHLAGLNGIPLTGSYTSDVVLSCMKIPILFHYTSNNKKRIYFSSFVGPQIDMINSVTFHVNGQEAPLKGTNITPKDVYNRTTVDAMFGAGIGINLTSYLTLTGNFCLAYSMGDVEKKSETLTLSGVQYKYYSNGRVATHAATAGLMVGVYYKFGKKEKKDTKPAMGGGKK